MGCTLLVMADAPDQPNGSRRTDLDRLRGGAGQLREIAERLRDRAALDARLLQLIAQDVETAASELQARRSGLTGGAPPFTRRWENVVLPGGVHPDNEGV